MASKWIQVVTPADGSPVVVEIPARVGAVRVIHDFTSGGTGDVDYTFDLPSVAQNGTPHAWISVISGGGADDHSNVLPVQATAVRLTSNTTAQRFILVGEN